MIRIEVDTKKHLIQIDTRLCALNAWEESQHKRDKNGKFAKQEESGIPIEIQGNELGSASMAPEELRARAIAYYKEHLAGTNIEHAELGKIEFSKSGFKKPVSFSADIRKLKLFPFLPEIIKKGQVVSRESDKRERQNVDTFFVLKSSVKMGGSQLNVRVSIRKDSNGNLYYDHVIAKPLANSTRLNESGLAKGHEKETGALGSQSQSGNSLLNNSITESDYEINLFLDDEE